MTTLLTTDTTPGHGRHRRRQSAGTSWGLAFLVGVAYAVAAFGYLAVQVTW